MKPSSFEYVKATTLEEAKVLLGRYGDDCKVLSGGQTLVPMMNYRLASPSVILDINDLPGLNQIDSAEGALKLGALVRWSEIETSVEIADANPLLSEAVRHIAHYQIRNRGTWAGSSAHADPAAEFPAVAIACNAMFCVESASAKRTIPAEEFFVGPLTTALEPDEILVEVQFPPWPQSRKWAFEEFAFRSGDFAIAGIAAVIDDREGHLTCRLVCFGMGDAQKRLKNAEAILAAEGLSESSISKVARAAAEEADAQDDGHAPADYRRALLETITYRALSRVAQVEERQ